MGTVLALDEAREYVAEGRQRGERYIMPIGTFNPPREHHFGLFEQAARYGTVIVAINDDGSLRVYRNGTGRDRDTMFELSYRLDGNRFRGVLASPHVTYVIPFGEPDASQTIRTVQPHAIMKGSDYTLETIHPDERAAAAAIRAEILFAGALPRDTRSLAEFIEDHRACEGRNGYA